MKVFDVRASVILFNMLVSLKKQRPHTSDKYFLIPSNVCPIVPAIFLKAKVSFDFLDVSLSSLCMDENLLIDRIKIDKNVEGVLYVKTFGVVFDSENLFQKIKKINNNIFVIDDCCLCPPNFDYKIENSAADAALFSTGYSKYIDIDWGGFGFLKDNFIYSQKIIPFNPIDLKKITLEMNNGLIEKSIFLYKDNDWLGSEIKLHDNIDDYSSQVIGRLDEIIKHKDTLNNIYSKNLNKRIQLGQEFWNWRFSIFVESKKELLDKIFDVGLFASSHYQDISEMYIKQETYFKNRSNANFIHSKIINLFNDFRFSEDDAYKVVKVINTHVNKEK